MIASVLSICLGIIKVSKFLYFFFKFLWTSPQISSSVLWVLEAHQVFLFLINFSISLLLFERFSFSDCENFRFPINLILFTPSCFKYFSDCLLEGKQRLILSNISLEKEGNIFHFSNEFLVILPLIKIIGILFLSRFLL